MGGVITSCSGSVDGILEDNSSTIISRTLQRTNTTASEMSLPSHKTIYGEKGEEFFKPSMKKKRSSLQRRKIIETYSSLIEKNFQRSNQFDKKIAPFIDFLWNDWINKIDKSIITTSRSSIISPRDALSDLSTAAASTVTANASNLPNQLPSLMINTSPLRHELDQLVIHMCQRKSIADELYHTMFSDYDLDLKDDGHNKVVFLNQLKTRESFIQRENKGKIGNNGDDKPLISNPYLSLDVLQSWFLLAFWAIFLELEAKKPPPKAPPSTPKSSRIAALLFPRRSAEKIVPIMENNNTINTDQDKEETPVVPFEPMIDTSTKSKSPKRKWTITSFTSSKKYFATSPKQHQRDHSITNDSNTVSRRELNFHENQLKQNIIKYSDIIGVTLQNTQTNMITPNTTPVRNTHKTNNNKNKKEENSNGNNTNNMNTPTSLNELIQSGKWFQLKNILFTPLDNMNLAISIFSVDRNGTFFPFIYLNKAWEQLTGYQREDLLGEDMTILMGNHTEESQSSRLGGCMKHGLQLKLGMNILKSNQKTYLYCLLYMIPIYDIHINYKYIVMKLYHVNENQQASITDLKYSDEVLSILSLSLRAF